jgi:hypothetical protein
VVDCTLCSLGRDELSSLSGHVETSTVLSSESYSLLEEGFKMLSAFRAHSFNSVQNVGSVPKVARNRAMPRAKISHLRSSRGVSPGSVLLSLWRIYCS